MLSGAQGWALVSDFTEPGHWSRPPASSPETVGLCYWHAVLFVLLCCEIVLFVGLCCKTLLFVTVLFETALFVMLCCETGVMMSSTKGASKARRDDMNGEIRNMRELLPLGPVDRRRLSYLHSMAAICTFIRKACYYPELQAEGSGSPLPGADLLQALPGFIVALTGEGKLLSVSENVEDYLGYSVVDVLQGDTFYDMVDSADVEEVRSRLEAASAQGTDAVFVCRFHTSRPLRLRQEGGGCSMLVRGRFQASPGSSGRSPSAPRRSLVALCTPTVDRLSERDAAWAPGHFQSSHRLDMTFHQVSDSVLFHLGYPEEQLIGRSWYGLLHPEDLRIGEAAHRRLQQGDEAVSVEMVLRLQHQDLSWVWLYVRAARNSGTARQEVSCTNYVISETEASFLRQKTGAHLPGALEESLLLGSPGAPGQAGGPSGGCKRHREGPRFEEEPWAKRGGVPVPERADHTWDICSPTLLTDGPVFPSTPPLSPDSAHSTILTEAQSPHFPYSYSEGFPPSQESSPPHQSLQTMSDTPFYPSGLGAEFFRSPSCYGFPASSTNLRLVPDFLSGPGPCGAVTGVEFRPEDFSLPAHSPEGAGPFLSVHSTALLTPDPSPTTAESHFLYSQEERAEISVLAQQISSLANSFHMCHSQSLAQNQHPTPSPALSSDFSSALSPDLSPTHNPTLSSVLSPTLSSAPSPTLCSGPSSTLSSALSSTLSSAPSPTLSSALSLPSEFSEASCSSPQESPREAQLDLDEEVIACLLGHLDQSPGPHPGLTSACPLTHTCTHPLLDVQGLMVFITAQEDKLTLDPCALPSGHHGNSNELYQLSQFPCGNLQQDGLLEESMY
ncbi:neuronal PAS domain-containing protein 4-like [Conger conger]|uniref:neuronal PAS domain-containing protein 4-like n=1 Tax=Conger conger TaxID=82655 RepID=UPI002A5A1773|nr:neuronal PAS domain-containing protein 4-like [Conger conger]